MPPGEHLFASAERSDDIGLHQTVTPEGGFAVATIAARPAKKPWFLYFGIGFGVLIAISIVANIVSPPPPKMAPAKPEVAQIQWNYQRPEFVANIRVRNSGGAPIKGLRVGIRFTDSMRQKVVGMDLLTFDLVETIKSGDSHVLVARVHAPDLPSYLATHDVPMSSINADIYQLTTIR